MRKNPLYIKQHALDPSWIQDSVSQETCPPFPRYMEDMSSASKKGVPSVDKET